MLHARCTALLILPALSICHAALAQPVRKCLVIGIDGLRPDALEAADAPRLHFLLAHGCYARNAQAEDLTFSGPNWSSILHGVHRDLHNVTTNDYSNSHLDQFPDFLAYLEQHNANLVTARLTTWDAIYIHQPTGADIDIFRNYVTDGDNLITEDAALLLTGNHPIHSQDPDVLFVYLSDVDVAGHTHGFHPSRPGYLAAIHTADEQVDRMLTAIESRPTYPDENWLIIITSDHGGAIDGSHAGNTPEKRTIPFIVNGPSVVPGAPFPQPRNVSVPITVLTFMGVPIQPTWSLDGRPVGLASSFRPPVTFGDNIIFNGDAEYDRGFADSLPDQYVSGWDDPGPDMITVIRYDSPGGWPLSSDPGPAERGNNFFSGGPNVNNHMSQTIDAAPLASAIDAGHVSATFSAYLGGYDSQADNAAAAVRFIRSDGSIISSASLGPVTPAQRGNRTGLLFRQWTGEVPSGTVSFRVELEATRAAGASCDGYADNISLVLSTSCPADFNLSGGVNSQDFFDFLAAFFAGEADFNRSGATDSQDFFDFLVEFFAGCK